MSRVRNKISKWNRRGDRARRKRQAADLRDTVTTVYQAPPGFRLVKIEATGTGQLCPVCGGELGPDDPRLKHLEN